MHGRWYHSVSSLKESLVAGGWDVSPVDQILLCEKTKLEDDRLLAGYNLPSVLFLTFLFISLPLSLSSQYLFAISPVILFSYIYRRRSSSSCSTVRHSALELRLQKKLVSGCLMHK